MTQDLVVRNSVAVADPDSPSHVIKPNADGSINVTATVTSEVLAEATAVAPTYTEGQNAPFSQNLKGGLRVTQVDGTSGANIAQATSTLQSSVQSAAGTPNATSLTVQGNASGVPVPVSGSVTIAEPTSSTMTATQVTVPATANGILLLAANASRKGAIISNPGSVSVFIQQAATGVTISNGFAITPGGSLSIDSPLYLGAIYGIVAAATQVVTVLEFT